MLAALFLAAVLGGQPPAPMPVVAAVQVQGNAVTSSDDISRLSGLTVGQPFAPDTIPNAESALRGSKRFAHVEVLQRFASLNDPSRILIVIIVDEGPLKLSKEGGVERIVRARGLHLLFTPLLGYEDGYGFAYGARFAKPDVLGAHSRVSMPLTWGGDKRAGVDLDKDFSSGPLSRAQVSLFASKRTNPFDEVDDSRAGVRVEGDREIVRHLTAGVWGSIQHVSFLAARDRLSEAGVTLTFDTRRDPFLARNAVVAEAGMSHISVRDAVSAKRTTIDAAGYIGLPGQAILVVRTAKHTADHALPLYEEPLVGGIESLRGFRAGYRAGDNVVSGTAELRLPLTSPLSLGKLGVRAFVDAGAAYPAGQRYRDQSIDHGVGGGVWFAATAFRLNLDVAHGIGAGTRVHFGTSLTF